MSKVISHPDLNKHMEVLAEDLKKRLQANSGVTYVRNKMIVKPKKEMEAALVEGGSATMKVAPLPFVTRTLQEFGKANKIKGL